MRVCAYLCVCEEELLICCNLPPEGVTMLQHPWMDSIVPSSIFSLHSFSQLTAHFFIITLVFTYPPALFSISSSRCTFSQPLQSSLNQQAPQLFIIPLSLFQWKQSTVNMFLYLCHRPCSSFIPTLSPHNIHLA